MSRRLLALMSTIAVISSLFAFTIASAESDPTYLIWKGDYTNHTQELMSAYGTDPMPIGGLQGEYLLIGSDQPFYGLEIEMENGAADGEFLVAYSYYGTSWVNVQDENLTEMEGTVRLEWDADEFVEEGWQTSYGSSDYDYDGTDNFQVIEAYWVVIETMSSSTDEYVISANSITLLDADDVSAEVTAEVTQQTIDTSSTSFSDTSHGSDSTVAIEYLAATGVVEGYSDGTYGPENTVNRAELMKFLVAGQGIEPTSYTSECFSDIPAGEWYEKYVCYAYDMGWVDGYPDGTFGPGNAVNKVEAAKMTVNALGFGDADEEIDYMLYSDVDTAQWYAPYVYQIQKYGVEDMDYTYGVSDSMTREKVASYIFRMTAVSETGESYYNTETRADFLESQGLSDLADYAYTTTSSNDDDDDDQGYYSVNMSFESFSDCIDPEVTITNYSGYSVDFSDWSLDPFYGDTVYPFSGVVLEDGEYETVTVYADFSEEDSSIDLRSDEGGIVASDWCN